MSVARRALAPTEPIRRPVAFDEFAGKWIAVSRSRDVIAFADSSREIVYKLKNMSSAITRGAVVRFVPAPSSAAMVGLG